MKTLLVLRHAKSDRDDTTIVDHARPLAPRGRADAPIMGAALAALGLAPDLILASTAVRARDTARLVAEAMAYGGRVVESAAVYDADVPALLGVLRACDDAHETVLLVGHNPGMEALIAYLIGSEGARVPVRMPTAALACLVLTHDHWAGAGAADGSLAWLLTPRIVRPLARVRR